MRSTAITVVLGVCGVLSFGCAEVKSIEKEAVSAAKSAEKSGALKDVEKAVEKKVEGKKDEKEDKPAAGTEKAATEKPATDKAAPEKAGGDEVERAVNSVVTGHGVKAEVKAGVVTLTGKVPTAKDKSDIEAAVKKIKGVTKVTDEVKVGK
jgi:osmotically-inducible protein OsmY